MKRALKWSLLLVGIPALAVGLLAIDACSRAVHALEVQETRLKADIAALRARHRTTSLLEGRDVSPQTLKGLPCPAKRFASAEVRGVGYDQGHSGQDSLYRMSFHELFTRGKSSPPIPLTVDELLISFAVNEHTFREGGFVAYHARRSYDGLALNALAKTLLRPDVGVPQLKELSAGLDQLLARRPPIAEILESEHLLDRAELLRIIPTRSDPHVMLLQPPGLAEFFSWRILVVKALNQLEDHYRELRRRSSAPIPEWESAAVDLGLSLQREASATRSNLCSGAGSLLEAERLSLCSWRFAQVATLLALFQVEKAREASGLQELVPEYLPELPLNPYNGKPFEYRDGTLRTAPSTSGPQLAWMLRRG